jgi:Gluconate 2-dehydrogenase subunit 3
MKRRTVIKQLAFASGALLLVPSCMTDKSKAGIILKKIKISGDQEKWLAELAETIIPATDKPGAKDISAHLFALKMVDDCYTKEQQEQFIKGLEAFDNALKKKAGKSFDAMATTERESFLTGIEADKADKSDLHFFYNNIKKLTIQAYTTSKFYLTNVQVYQLVPGAFKGCVPVKAA